MNTVKAVMMVRERVSLMLRLSMSSKSIFVPYFLMLSLILSKMTMVSLTEYPTMVSRAAITVREIS
ncbi:MAG: hypothetical protein BWY86_01305 [Candidatus Aminicenantes bacterium ADurb.Bin508]|nr:MAG: hypothetical protein BWY86_01305 [Candidatus Aminicenantes bacterium ADurb.Bin508]